MEEKNCKKILVVVDMQNDFVDGSLGTTEAVAIVENVKNKILQYDHDMVYATKDTHFYNYLSTQEGELLPIRHCIIGTDGWEIVEPIFKLIGAHRVYEKQTFGSYNLADDLAYECFKDHKNTDEYPEIEIVGVCTDICVISNALMLKSKIPHAKIIVDASCCAGTTPDRHREALDIMRSCQIYVINDGEEND